MAQPEGPAISATVPDWSRECPKRYFDPGPRFLRAHRRLERLAGRRAPLRRRLALLRHLFWRIVGQIDVPPGTRIGGGLLLPHANGIVIHPDCEIGPNCLLMHQVTLGHGRGGVPRLGGHVDVGAGAKLIGGIVIGDHATIGAGAVVVRDVAPGTTVVGNPARPIAKA